MAQRTLLSAYLIVGEDELKSRTALTRLKGRLDEGLAAFNLDEHAASGTLEAQAVLISLNTLPVGDGFRLVVIERAERLSKSVSEALVAYLKNPNEGCVLCLVASKLAKNTRLYKAVAAVGRQAIIDCTPKRRWELAPLVQSLARAHGMRMGEAAAGELVGRVGESTTLLDTQVRSLAALKGDAGEITLEDVRAHVARVAEVKPWDFLDALSQRNLPRALELYGLMDNPSEVALTSLVEGRLRELICARSLDRRGEGGSLATALGRAPWMVKHHLGWSRRFGAGELEQALAACATCERRLKGGLDQKTAFLELMAVVCA